MYLLLLALDNEFDAGGEWKIYVYLAVAGVVGAICGIVTICVYYIGLFLVGGSVGFLLSWFLLAVINITYFQQHLYIPLLIAVAAGILCGIVTLIFQKWLVIIGTSVVGGFLMAWSIDYYLELGRMVYFLFLFAEHRGSLSLCWFSWLVLVVFVVLIIVGLIVQGAITGRKYNHKEDFKCMLSLPCNILIYLIISMLRFMQQEKIGKSRNSWIHGNMSVSNVIANVLYRLATEKSQRRLSSY